MGVIVYPRPRIPVGRREYPHHRPLLRFPSPPLSLNTGKGVVAHRDGGTDPTELGQSVQQEIHRPTAGAP